MKMKKIVSLALSAILLVSVVAAAAFAAESVPSKTGSDADAGSTDFTVSGPASADGMVVRVEVTEDSAAEEAKLKAAGLEGYFGTAAVDRSSEILGTSKDNLTVNGIKQIIVSGYKRDMGKVAIRMPFASLPKVGTRVAVVVRIMMSENDPVNLPVDGVVVEETTTVNGVARKVRKVELILDSDTLVNIQAHESFVAAVTVK